MELKDINEKVPITSASMQLSDVMDLMNNFELKSSIPFMGFNRATRRSAEKQAKQHSKRIKKLK